jgi:hypothetical protein
MHPAASGFGNFHGPFDTSPIFEEIIIQGHEYLCKLPLLILSALHPQEWD